MPITDSTLKFATAILLAAATGAAAAQGVQGPKSHVAGTANIPINTPPAVTINPTPCPGVSAPVIQKGHFLIVNRTNAALSCRMRHPTVGGWSPFAGVTAGTRMLDRRIDLDEIVVQCKPPVRIVPVRVFPGRRYALLRPGGNMEVRLVEVVEGQ